MYRPSAAHLGYKWQSLLRTDRIGKWIIIYGPRNNSCFVAHDTLRQEAHTTITTSRYVSNRRSQYVKLGERPGKELLKIDFKLASVILFPWKAVSHRRCIAADHWWWLAHALRTQVSPLYHISPSRLAPIFLLICYWLSSTQRQLAAHTTTMRCFVISGRNHRPTVTSPHHVWRSWPPPLASETVTKYTERT